MVNEAKTKTPTTPFSFSEPLIPLSQKHQLGFIVYRTFKMHVPDELAKHIGMEDDEFIEGDVADFEHEIELDVSGMWHSKHYPATREQPAEYPEFDIRNMSVVSIDGFKVGPGDARALKAYVGDLTPREYDEVAEQNQPDPYDYEPDDY